MTRADAELLLTAKAAVLYLQRHARGEQSIGMYNDLQIGRALHEAIERVEAEQQAEEFAVASQDARRI